MRDLAEVIYHGFYRKEGRGITHSFKIAGSNVQVYITEKRRKVRVFVDHEEYTKA